MNQLYRGIIKEKMDGIESIVLRVNKRWLEEN